MSSDGLPELGEITAVEVVDLRHMDANHVDQYMSLAPDCRGVRFTGERAERIVSLYRTLPPGNQARCHIPPYGLRMFRDNQLVCEVSICWRCDNLFGEANGQSFSFEFDSASSTAQELLAELQNAVEEF